VPAQEGERATRQATPNQAASVDDLLEAGETLPKGWLGLAISKRFCQMMGGDIVVESKPGQGSTFTIWLPRIVDAKQPADAKASGTARARH
jgi:light-regulated signal transduction histidine kinase (bacteriophytochrome)